MRGQSIAPYEYDLALVRLAGGPVRVVASGRPVDYAWSPDGSKIAYVRDWRVWVMTARGKRAHIVSPVDALVWRVDWQRR